LVAYFTLLFVLNKYTLLFIIKLAQNQDKKLRQKAMKNGKKPGGKRGGHVLNLENYFGPRSK